MNRVLTRMSVHCLETQNLEFPAPINREIGKSTAPVEVELDDAYYVMQGERRQGESGKTGTCARIARNYYPLNNRGTVLPALGASRLARQLSTSHSSYGGASWLGSMIYRLGERAYIASGCGNFKSSPYLLVIEGFDQNIVATLLQDI